MEKIVNIRKLNGSRRGKVARAKAVEVMQMLKREIRNTASADEEFVLMFKLGILEEAYERTELSGVFLHHEVDVLERVLQELSKEGLSPSIQKATNEPLAFDPTRKKKPKN